MVRCPCLSRSVQYCGVTDRASQWRGHEEVVEPESVEVSGLARVFVLAFGVPGVSAGLRMLVAPCVDKPGIDKALHIVRLLEHRALGVDAQTGIEVAYYHRPLVVVFGGVGKDAFPHQFLALGARYAVAVLKLAVRGAGYVHREDVEVQLAYAQSKPPLAIDVRRSRRRLKKRPLGRDQQAIAARRRIRRFDERQPCFYQRCPQLRLVAGLEFAEY